MAHITIYRDSLGLPQFATVVSNDDNPDELKDISTEIRQAICDASMVYVFDGHSVEVV